MSQWVKTFLPQQEIKTSLLLSKQASIITTRPQRHHYIHPSKEKVYPHRF